MLRIGQKFFDESQSRYLTIDGVGADPKLYRCIQEEYVCDEQGNSDFEERWEITGTVLLTENELKRMEVIA